MSTNKSIAQEISEIKEKLESNQMDLRGFISYFQIELGSDKYEAIMSQFNEAQDRLNKKLNELLEKQEQKMDSRDFDMSI